MQKAIYSIRLNGHLIGFTNIRRDAEANAWTYSLASENVWSNLQEPKHYPKSLSDEYINDVSLATLYMNTPINNNIRSFDNVPLWEPELNKPIEKTYIENIIELITREYYRSYPAFNYEDSITIFKEDNEMSSRVSAYIDANKKYENFYNSISKGNVNGLLPDEIKTIGWELWKNIHSYRTSIERHIWFSLRKMTTHN